MSHQAPQGYLFQIRWNTGRRHSHLSHHKIVEHIGKGRRLQAQRIKKEKEVVHKMMIHSTSFQDLATCFLPNTYKSCIYFKMKLWQIIQDYRNDRALYYC